MQESNFEKQAKHKMDELKISPSAGVWERVALEIEKKKRGRRALIISSLVIIFIVTTFISWFNNSRSETSSKSIASGQDNFNGKKNSNTKTTNHKDYGPGLGNNKKEVLKTNSRATAAIPVQSDSTLHQQKTFKQNQVNRYLRVGSNLIEDGDKKNYKTSKDKEKRQAKSSNITYTKGPKTTIKITAGQPTEFNDNKNVIIGNDGGGREPANDNMASFLIEPIEAADTTAKPNNNLPVIEDDVKESLSSGKTKSEKVKKSKWEFGVNFSLGVSATRNSYLGINLFDESKASDQYSSVGGSNSSTGGGPIYYPSATKFHYGFVTGVYAQKPISRKIGILTGINYKLYSTRMSIGTRIDSVGNLNSFSDYYRAGNKAGYINRFHFIAFPVFLQWNISNQQKRPVYLYSGFTLSKLVSSSALQFNSTGVYFRDNSLFNTTQFELSAKLLFALNKKQEHPILIGPDLSYSMSKVAKAGLYKRTNYSYLGIHIQKGITTGKH